MRFHYNPAKYICYFICAVALLMLASCSATKYIPQGDALYTGATVKLKDSISSKKEKKSLLTDLKKLPRPKPNSKLLGIPLKVLIYNMGGNPEKKSKIRNIFRKFGQPPVLLSSLNLEFNNKVIRNYLENVGYFKAEVSGDTVIKRKKAHATYTVSPGHVYKIKEVQFVTDSTPILKSIKLTEPGTFLKPGDPFNLDVIKGERTRIDAILKEQGYYYFGPDLLVIDADSTIGDNKVNMYLKLKENTPYTARKPYIIDDVFIYSNFRLNSARVDTVKAGSQSYNGYFIIDRANRFKQRLFPRILRFDSGDVYNRKDHNLTLNRLINLDVFKFVKNRFEVSPQTSKTDTGRLNAFYYLTPQPKKSLRAELSGNTKSNNYVGSLVRFSFRNRNTFRGAEQLEVHANVGSEVQYSGTNSGFNSFRLGGGLSFSIPKFVVPFFRLNTTSAYVPRTRIALDYELLNRQKLYTLTSIRGELGYVWKPEVRKEHQFNPIAINYVEPLNITQLYLDSIKRDLTLRQAVDTQFILGSNYTYTFDQLVNDRKATGFFFSGNLDLSGNIAGLATGANIKNGNQKRIFGAPFSQYIKTQV
ncbi:MAG: hypothetical protein H0V14_06840, partial [Chitinophagaceae bacterium]|nr:hypothetical protein [Chitinophagaceae bacterium]